MSSINLDLDFQDYSGSASRAPQQQPEIQVRIPPPSTDSATTAKQQSSGNTILNVLRNLQSNQSTSGLSEEALQQLIWLSGKQKNKHQRGSITSGSNWGLGFFAQYFDVTTEDVLQRILWSVVPVRKTGIDFDDLDNSELTAPLTSNLSAGPSSPTPLIENDNFPEQSSSSSSLLEQLGNKRKHYSYMERFIQSRPDLYGPFWISITLIFSVAIWSNIANFRNYQDNLDRLHQASELLMSTNVSDNVSLDKFAQMDNWHYSMDELNMAASLVMFYVTLLPTFLWFLFWFRGCTKYYTLTETICAYGYSLSIFIPTTFLLMAQDTLFRYIVITVASLSSGLVLVMSFLPMVKSDPNKGSSHIILVLVFACQLGLAYVLHRIMLL